MRASDILMDRVWQLENETFKDTPGFVFARITDFVDPDEDPTALHPEVQRQLPSIRTDLDRFSDIEISGLVRHGYTVGRKICLPAPRCVRERTAEVHRGIRSPSPDCHICRSQTRKARFPLAARRRPLRKEARILHCFGDPSHLVETCWTIGTGCRTCTCRS